MFFIECFELCINSEVLGQLLMQLFLVHRVSVGAAVVVDFLLVVKFNFRMISVKKYNYQCFTDSYIPFIGSSMTLKCYCYPTRKLVIDDIVHRWIN